VVCRVITLTKKLVAVANCTQQKITLNAAEPIISTLRIPPNFAVVDL
jgi:hypothetical protein